MEIYKTVRFELKNEDTGQVTKETRRQWVETRCDYTGEVIDGLDDAYCTYSCDYGLSDPCFGDVDLEDDLDDLGVDIFNFMSQEYVFTSAGEARMLHEMAEMVGRFRTIDSFFRFFRAQTALRLIQEGEIQPESLNKEEEW